MHKDNDLTTGPIYKKLLLFAAPILFAMLLQMMYGAVDMAIIGRFCESFSVSAASNGSWIVMTITVPLMGLSVGTSVTIGQKFGEKNLNAVSQATATSIWLFAALGVLLALCMQPLARPCALAMRTPPEALEEAVAYIKICSAGFVFITMFNLIGSIFKGIGNSVIPLISVAIACVINIAGDLLLVAVFGMGVAGTAIATIFAQAVSVLISLIIIKSRDFGIKLDKKHLKPDFKMLKTIVGIGAPIALQDSLVSFSFLVVLAIINTLGVTASAGAGVAERLCGFIMLVPSTFAQAVSTFTAQNIGAGTTQRIKKALVFSAGVSFAVGLLFFWLTFFHGDMLSTIFASGKQDVIAQSWAYLKAYSIDCVFVSFLFCFIGYFTGRGKTRFVLIQGLVGAFFVRIPVSYFMSKALPVSLFKVGLATPCSTVVQILIFVGYMALFGFGDKKKTAK